MQTPHVAGALALKHRLASGFMTSDMRSASQAAVDRSVSRAQDQDHGGWIDVPLCEELLSKPQNIIVAVDGSDASMVGFKYVTEGVMQKNRDTTVQVMHVFDRSKTYLPAQWRPDSIKNVVENTLTGAVSQKRYRITWLDKDGMTAARHLTMQAQANKADFVVIGYTGRKGTKDKNLLASNVQESIRTVGATVICIKDETPELLPLKRPTKFVVSVSLNKASTKAVLDALRLSQPGDEIHVVYVKSFMERTDSDYTTELRGKYDSFFQGLKDGESHVFSKFHDRKTEFIMVKKQRRETTAQAVVRYGEEIEADFMVVGTNTLRRIERGKSAVGSVSLDICMEWERNFIVSHWIDIDPRLYEEYSNVNN